MSVNLEADRAVRRHRRRIRAYYADYRNWKASIDTQRRNIADELSRLESRLAQFDLPPDDAAAR